MSRLGAFPRKRSKYGAVPTTVDGIRFDSKAEARRYQELKLLVLAGEVRDLELQPEYPLLVRSRDGGFVRIGVYRADFRYRSGRQGLLVVEDVKGVRTPLYKWKRRHTTAQYGIDIKEV
jgi:hypothetical protein